MLSQMQSNESWVKADKSLSSALDCASVNTSQEAAQPLSLSHTEPAVCQGPHSLLSWDDLQYVSEQGASPPHVQGVHLSLLNFMSSPVNPLLQPGQIPPSRNLAPVCTNCLSSENFSVCSATSSRSPIKTLQAPCQSSSSRETNLVVKDFWIFPGWRFPAKSLNTWSLPQLAAGTLFPHTSICMRASILTSEEI